MSGVLVLNADNTALHTVSVKHAIGMLVREVAVGSGAPDGVGGSICDLLPRFRAPDTQAGHRVRPLDVVPVQWTRTEGDMCDLVPGFRDGGGSERPRA